ncbi:propionyl-CoA synthetase [Eisenibacter elegans]|uniref:propionyl-CoA synthetase n=1 Tax=Eisenibacter elegans TaxID=997 RepID=UPI00040555DD|nr:propionyl-CoA synthetase [Eisenibacter elegans]
MSYQDTYQLSIKEPQLFWSQQAAQLPWYTYPKQVLTKNEQGFYRWFEGGKLNTAYMAVDWHIKQGRGAQLALIYDSPVTDTVRRYTYQDLGEEVARLAGLLRQLGVQKGDRVIIYMPMIPEAAFAMLACARLGAVHSVVFGGFAAHELALRIDDALPKLILTASCGIEGDKIIPYKPLVDKALLESSHQPQAVLLYQRPQYTEQLAAPYIDWAEALSGAPLADCVPVDAHDPLYILYTSGTTGKPKGIVRDNGGHAVAMYTSLQHTYGMQPGEVFWAASDLGWAVGHSYIVYAPLILGCTTILFEGKPVKTPNAGTFWRVIDQHKVQVFFTAPTAFRAIKKEDSQGLLHRTYDTSSLRYLFLAGERCDVDTYNWATQLLGVPVIDHWWQTESGHPMLANPIGLEPLPIRPGSAGKPACGFDVRVLREDGQPAAPNEEGLVVVKLPLPPGCLPTLWNDDTRFQEAYMSRFKGFYFTGDGGYRDKDGYVFITGRVDDLINVAGHRLSTAEMEEMVAAHPAVAECAVIGIADPLKGQRPVGLVVLKDGVSISATQLEAELVAKVREDLGAVAFFKNAAVVKRLPKTRSGKILRRVMRKIADGEPFTMPSTIDDPVILEEIKETLASRGIGIAFEAE